MKVKLRNFLIFLVIMMSGSLFAQTIEPPSEPIIVVGDTLYVFPTYNSVEFDALGKWIAYGHSLDPAVKVFKLARNETYKVSHNVVVNGDLTIVADKPDAENAPPYIVAATDLDNAFPGDLIEVNGNLIAKYLYFCGQDIEAQVIGEGSDAEFGLRNIKDGGESTVDGCYFEWLRGGILVTNAPAEDGTGNKVTFINNLIMNNKNAAAGKWANWWGWAILGGGQDAEIILRNNTYMNTPGPFFHNWKLTEKSMIVDHNTIINNSIYTFFNTEWSNHTIKNNLFLNAQSEGIERQGLNLDSTLAQGIIYVDSLSRYDLDSAYAADNGIARADVESHRKFTLKNNYVGWESWVDDYWATADSLTPTPWMNSRVQAMFEDKVTYPNFVEENTYTMAEYGHPLALGKEAYGGDKTKDLFLGYLQEVLNGRAVTPARYYFTPGEPDPQPNPALVWPLQLDLRVGNSALVGDDGKPVGDLNWYPEYAERWNPNVLVTDVEAVNDLLPEEYSLEQNYPNPFNPSTTINFGLKIDSDVSLRIYNVLGQEVATLVNTKLKAGFNKVDFNSTNLTSGVYFYRIEAAGVDGSKFVSIKKMMFLK
jgi:Secretion system C-terminal sorting domain